MSAVKWRFFLSKVVFCRKSGVGGTLRSGELRVGVGGEQTLTAVELLRGTIVNRTKYC